VIEGLREPSEEKLVSLTRREYAEGGGSTEVFIDSGEVPDPTSFPLSKVRIQTVERYIDAETHINGVGCTNVRDYEMYVSLDGHPSLFPNDAMERKFDEDTGPDGFSIHPLQGSI